MVHVHVTAPLHPTEVQERVVESITAFWPDLDVSVANGVAQGTSGDVQNFRDRVWEARIVDTARGQMLHRVQGPTVSFWLSKQAALHEKISFPPAQHALGHIDVTFTVEESDSWADAEALVWWLCPETEDGVIVGDGSVPKPKVDEEE